MTAVGTAPRGTTVNLLVDGTSIGSVTADSRGVFRVAKSVPDLPVGRHKITASCGSTEVSATVDLIQTGSIIGTAGADGAAAAAVLAFFVLLGSALLRMRNTSSSGGTHRPSHFA